MIVMLLLGVVLLLVVKSRGSRRKGAKRPEAAMLVMTSGENLPGRRVPYRFRGSDGGM